MQQRWGGGGGDGGLASPAEDPPEDLKKGLKDCRCKCVGNKYFFRFLNVGSKGLPGDPSATLQPGTQVIDFLIQIQTFSGIL